MEHVCYVWPMYGACMVKVWASLMKFELHVWVAYGMYVSCMDLFNFEKKPGMGYVWDVWMKYA